MENSRSLEILLVSTADWNAELWTNKQNIASILSRYGKVTYWNSLGLRRPRLNLSDMRRVWSRLNGSRKRHSHPAGSIRVKSPLVLPFHKATLPRVLNRLLVWLQSRQWRKSANFRILWTYSPEVYGLSSNADAIVYHCVDFLGRMPRVNPSVIQEAQSTLCSMPRLVSIGSSVDLVDYLKAVGFDPILWTNVADVSSIEAASRGAGPRALDVVFVGNLTESKVDFELLRELADALPGNLHIIGPAGIDGTELTPASRSVLDHPSVIWHGVQHGVALAQLLGSARVGIIPYQVSPYTSGIFPMKVYEYMAAGLAVVSTPISSLRDVHFVDLADRDMFVEVVLDRLNSTEAAREERIAEAQRNSWSTREDQVRALLEDVTSRGLR